MGKRNVFQEQMETHLVEFKTNQQYLPPINDKKQWQYHDIADNIFPPIRHGLLQYLYDKSVPLHDYVNHVRSSQMFCINIFYQQILN